MNRVERYAFDTVLRGAESYREDDIDEDGELNDDEEHISALDVAYHIILWIGSHEDLILNDIRA